MYSSRPAFCLATTNKHTPHALRCVTAPLRAVTQRNATQRTATSLGCRAVFKPVIMHVRGPRWQCLYVGLTMR